MNMFNRKHWCWLLGHEPDDAVSARRTENDLVNIPQYKWCAHCGHNLGEDE